MSSGLSFDASLTWADRTVLTILNDDIVSWSSAATHREAIGPATVQGGKLRNPFATREAISSVGHEKRRDGEQTEQLRTANNPQHRNFEPSVFSSVDLRDLTLPVMVDKLVLRPYISWARRIMRVETDVIMLTHLLIYVSTTVPSALVLFYHFTYRHALLHIAMQSLYTGSYTLMMHQHIHQRGILAKRFGLIDHVFPYILDPMMGHTWNAYYYHHVKHHHVEGNGPDDLSSTLRYQRDSTSDFVCYIARFYLLVWLELPLYFWRKSQPGFALRAGFSEFMTYIFYYAAVRFNAQAAFFVYLLPLMLLRVGLMVGNWGQHAFVDPDQPGSALRSSITVIDVAVSLSKYRNGTRLHSLNLETDNYRQSNRFCYNDGYHTSHHLNPLRHWREHPVSFLEQKETYIKEGAIVLHNIDYLMITVRLLMKDYEALAKCIVPMGDQMSLTMDGRVELLKKLTTKLTAERVREKYPIYASRHTSDPR